MYFIYIYIIDILKSIMYIIDFRERGRERKQNMDLCCSTYLGIILLFALTEDLTHSLSVFAQCSNRLSYRARPPTWGLPHVAWLFSTTGWLSSMGEHTRGSVPKASISRELGGECMAFPSLRKHTSSPQYSIRRSTCPPRFKGRLQRCTPLNGEIIRIIYCHFKKLQT